MHPEPQVLPKLLANSVFRRALNFITTIYWGFVLKKIGKSSKLYKGVFFTKPQNVEIGERCLIQFNARFGSEISNAKLSISDDVQINSSLDFRHPITEYLEAQNTLNAKIAKWRKKLDDQANCSRYLSQ